MARKRNIKALFKEKFKTYQFEGVWGKALGETEDNGAWIVWGREKNGKTSFALMLAKEMTKFKDVLYVSGEEGLGQNFIKTLKRVGVDDSVKKLRYLGYVSIMELREILSKPRAEKIVFIDNMTIYDDELKYGAFKKLLKDFPDVLFVFLAHEEKKAPHTGTAKLCKKLAKVIIHVDGLLANVSGRCPGGTVVVNEEKAQICWGTEIVNS